MLANSSARFGYQQDGERAVLWTRNSATTTKLDREVSRLRPSQSGQHLEELVNVEVVIR